MKHYATLLLSSTILLASLAPTSAILAQESTTSPPIPTITSSTDDLTDSNHPITTQQNGQILSVFYQRSEPQKNHKIQYAIWSNHNGQDDLRWYVADEYQTDINLVNHKDTGTYTIHSYITIQDRLVFLEEATVTLTKPKPILTSNVSETGFLDIYIQHIPDTVSQVKVPIWSDKNGQDDLIWYTATAQPDGNYHLRVPLHQHKADTGLYHIHLYTQDSSTGKTNPISSNTFQIESQHIPANQPPLISIQQLKATKGTYHILVTPQPYTKKIKEIHAATWSTANQGNLKWRKVPLQNGSYTIAISFQEHQNHTGHYQNHVYITYEDGSRVGYNAGTVDLTTARLPVTFESTFTSPGHLTATFSNIYDREEVSFAVWSDENGQDDLKWYTATTTKDRTVAGTIPLQNHIGVGKYHVHAYQGKNGLGAFTMQVTAEQRMQEINTYPVGQCTWGAKEKAPWVRNYWGNASQWLTSARNAGFKTGTTPRLGAVAVWTNGYGHVGVITAIKGNLIQIEESNYAGNMRVGNYRGWFNPAADGVTGYIYPN